MTFTPADLNLQVFKLTGKKKPPNLVMITQ